MSTESTVPYSSVPKAKKFDQQNYVQFVSVIATKIDAHLILPELSNNASIYAFEDETAFNSNIANSNYHRSTQQEQQKSPRI